MKDINKIKEHLKKISTDAKADVKKNSEVNFLHFLKSKYLGKKSAFSDVLKSLTNFDDNQKSELGKLVNNFKMEIMELINEKIVKLEQEKLEKELKENKIDVTLPGIGLQVGYRNPLFLVIDEITTIFKNLGYQVISGTEVDNEEYNFNRLNLPENHPARAMQDTFYLNDTRKGKNRMLLRTHCTNMTARILSLVNKDMKEPLAYISLGNVYRKDDDDATHSHQFMQMDAFLAGHGVTFANLKWTLEYFCQKLFKADSKIRLRPSFFPFTEPSAEVDVSCPICGGRGCALCKHTGWIEILGAGMIHPNVFHACGIKDPNITGFAFGVGIERIAMIKYSIDDIRLFYSNDLRFLKQF
ncbi:phenylalanine--tRNA ligase subunit alpha [Spiroplasma platyhelix]|uniref:Phenylalanine--tRNA ligase alpha subunit n=1 Tax=Spiroplasma platyhelix PALS-1 TaxID=1276218 RepID=A0A846TTA3_9MOLU|nr:phenylalanine--tRNA ligase subunit alpha [Spiroplasma platyhelix]MBE4704363.1 Phenylalanine--tRNA ligase alpha subunit [Spiroplasma platyhelix PALS-1]NKE38735.1 phenylalanine--tRNA ligase subunit alpha [Spiroplasma platyhelix PALS-1]UJB28946.1 phenylalanyl-tRNA synthetase subunit alpha [Spiroplasma platyhelix PALS-1]